MKARTLLLLAVVGLTATTCPDRNHEKVMQFTDVTAEPYRIPVDDPTSTISITLKEDRLISNSDSIKFNFTVMTASEGIIYETSRVEDVPDSLTKDDKWNLTYELAFDFETRFDSIPLFFHWTIYKDDHERTSPRLSIAEFLNTRDNKR